MLLIITAAHGIWQECLIILLEAGHNLFGDNIIIKKVHGNGDINVHKFVWFCDDITKYIDKIDSFSMTVFVISSSATRLENINWHPPKHVFLKIIFEYLFH